MKFLFYIFIFLSLNIYSQDCINITKVTSSAKFSELNSKESQTNIKQTLSEVLTTYGYCLSTTGNILQIELIYFGNKRTDSDFISKDGETEVCLSIGYDNKVYVGAYSIEKNVRDVILQFMDYKISYNETDMANLIRKAIHVCVLQLPKRE